LDVINGIAPFGTIAGSAALGKKEWSRRLKQL
jgi:hypothetical protein